MLLETVCLPGRELARSLNVLEQRVDHRVPDKGDALGRHPFRGEVLVCALGVRQQQARQVVGEPAIVLFRHRPVEAA